MDVNSSFGIISWIVFGALAGYFTSDQELNGSSTSISYQGGSLGAYATYLKGGFFADLDPDDLEAIYRVNLLTPVQLCRAVLPGMLERGRGHLVNVSSLAGVAAYPGMAAYASTKAGLTQFTEVLSLDLKGLPVGTTVVQLGPIPTDMLDHVNDYAPTRDSFDRGYKLKLIVDIPREQVAGAIVEAVRKGRSHIRLPKRAAAFPLLAEAPRRISDLLLTGVRHLA